MTDFGIGIRSNFVNSGQKPNSLMTCNNRASGIWLFTPVFLCESS
jgi:hypothetical protein